MPAQDAANAQAAIRSASTSGAQSDPRSDMYLSYAKQSASRATKLSKQDEHESAKLLYDDAAADAELSYQLNMLRQAEAQCQMAKRRLEGAQ
jgi:hypothetical protein